MKRGCFTLVALALGVSIAVLAVEAALRIRSEHSVAAGWATVGNAAAPFSGELPENHWAVPDPRAGYRLNPDYKGHNSYSFRGPEPELEPPAGLVRLLFLGDSVTWPRDGFVARLRDRLDGQAEVLNAGVPGYTTHQEIEFYRSTLSELAPDLVVLVFCMNDLHLFLHRFDAEANMLFTEESRRVLARGDGPLSWLTDRSFLALRLRLALLRRQTTGGEWPWSWAPDFVPAWQQEPWDRFADQLQELQGIVGGHGGRLAVIMAPYAPQLIARVVDRDRDYVLSPQRRMREACERAGVPLLDLYPAFDATLDTRLFVDPVHFSDEGHDVAAEAAGPFLDRLLVPAGQ